MTQFIVVRRSDDTDETSYRGLVEIPVAGEVAGVDVASLLGCSAGDRMYRVASDVGREADDLVDEVADAVSSGRDLNNTALLRYLKQQIEHGASIAMWYGADAAELPIVSDWIGFRSQVLMQIDRAPPELYCLLVQ